MPEDNKTPTAPAKPATTSTPKEITLAADYVWFNGSEMVYRMAGDVIHEDDHIKYLLSIGAKLKSE